MNYNNVEFECSAGTARGLIMSDLPEVCFVGKSNVGKSSLINKVMSRKNLAFTGSKPGKTVTVNFYRNDQIRFVDMPGYGYAKVSDDERRRWGELCEGYFQGERNIKICFMLIDIRRTPNADDLQMIDFFRQCGINFCIVLTKSDKPNKTERNKSIENITAMFNDVRVIPFSAQNGEGLEEIKSIIEE